MWVKDRCSEIELSPAEFVEYLSMYRERMRRGLSEETARTVVGLKMANDPRIPDDVRSMWGIPILRTASCKIPRCQ